ncbi:MAG: dihydrodipicolinate reductase C-terminal domain-containing protein, partial [Candidatus Tumulicola sp.]
VQGRMGRVAVEALASSADFAYAGGLARRTDAASATFDAIDALFAQGEPDVLLDVTTHPGSVRISMGALERGVRVVVGASGWTAAETEALGRLAEERSLGAMIVPNFSTGAVLMMRFAEEAARYFPRAEIVEMHRSEKKDKPSGTALQTGARIERSGGAKPEIHSVRLPGLVAHQEVLFGNAGELLTIRHDSFSRESFVPGILASLRAVMRLRGLRIGLDAILDEMRAGQST